MQAPSAYILLFMLLFGGLLFHSVVRVVFWAWNFKNYSPSIDLLQAFLWGLRFDLSASAALLAPAFLFLWFLGPWISERVIKWALFLTFIGLFVPALFINFLDVEMINIVGRRFAWQTLFLINEGGGKIGAFVSEYLPMTIVTFTALGLVLWWSSCLVFGWKLNAKGFAAKLWVHYFSGFFVLVFFVLAIRGGLQEKPLNFTHSQIYQSSWLNHLVLNSTFSIIKSMGQEPLQRRTFFSSPEEKFKFLNGSMVGASGLEGRRAGVPQNVVVIILESFGTEYLGQGYTPFFDSLTKRSLYFPNGVANGRRSIEGVPAILTGVPTLMDEPFITSPFATNKIIRLPHVLGEHNYTTGFFHGGNNGTMYFDSFSQSIGFESYFGAKEYPHQKDHDGVWGIYDEPFFQFFADTISNFKQPFFASVFSLSSHHPYKIPPDMESRFPEGPLPILKAIAYTDYALKNFFDRVETEAWYKDTLFVVTADHTQSSFRPEFQNEISKYKIPILFFHPSFNWPSLNTAAVVQQIDIPVSILDFLNIKIPDTNPLAQSAFIEGDKVAVVRPDNRYMLVAEDYFLDWPSEKPIAMYDIKDPGQKYPLAGSEERRVLLENKLKAAIEFFSNGMLDNKLTILSE